MSEKEDIRKYYWFNSDQPKPKKSFKLSQILPVAHGSEIGAKVGNELSFQYRRTANIRERVRMKNMTTAFQTLKSMIPWIPLDTKLSKVDTLRLALLHIKMLTKILNDDEEGAEELFAESCQRWPWNHKAYFAQLSNESNSEESDSNSTINFRENISATATAISMEVGIFGENNEFLDFDLQNDFSDDIWNQLNA